MSRALLRTAQTATSPGTARRNVAGSPAFQRRMTVLAHALGRPCGEVLAEAQDCLQEMVTGRNRAVLRLALKFYRFSYSRAYDEQLQCVPAEVERVRAAFTTAPGVYLMSHRSNMDAGVLPAALARNALPIPHGLAGDNMSFWPLGAIWRRAGVIFIRRSTSDDPVYRATLREYLGHLLERRAPISWSIEGTRSRTGKMLPPKLGVLVYVVDAYREGRVDDVVLAPVSIAYDQLHEVAEFAAYARGAPKKKENLGWFYRYLRAQRGHYGRIYVNFAEPVSLRGTLERADGDAVPHSHELERLALTVAWRINQVTPVTAAALVTLILLGAQGKALTLEEISARLKDMVGHARHRGMPMTESAAALETQLGITRTLQALCRHRVVSHQSEGWDPVWRIDSRQQLAASVYRNSLVHHFLETSLAELALAGVARRQPPDPAAAFWRHCTALRELLKFDFYFPERGQYIADIGAEMARRAPGWQDALSSGPAAAESLMQSFRPLTAHVTVRSFLEAYGVVAEVLLQRPGHVDAADLLARCRGVARQFRWQGRLTTSESTSSLLLQTAIQLADHRGLLGGEGAGPARAAFAAELRETVADLRLVAAADDRQYEGGLPSGDGLLAPGVLQADVPAP